MLIQKPQLANDDNLSQYLESLCNIADKENLSNLTPPERVTVFVWWAKALVDNGGFQCFYEGAFNTEEVAKAFDEVGLTSVSNAFYKSLAVYPNRVPISDQKLRRDWLSQQNSNIKNTFAELDDVVWNVETTELLTRIRAYILLHKSEFRELV